jgi:uncharacterized membrane protein
VDEVLYLLIAVGAVLAIPILGIVGFVRGGRAERELALLKKRVAALEAALAGQPLADAPPTAAPVAAAGPWATAAPREAPAPAPADGASPMPPVEPVAEPVPEPLPVAATTSAAPKQSLEEKIAGRWAVWLGGGTIALAAIFLVRYSIEEGLLGPTARILLGLALRRRA